MKKTLTSCVSFKRIICIFAALIHSRPQVYKVKIVEY